MIGARFSFIRVFLPKDKDLVLVEFFLITYLTNFINLLLKLIMLHNFLL